MPDNNGSRWAHVPGCVVIGTIIGVLIVLALAYLLTAEFFGRPEGPGTFGDMFGGVNALFSGLAFAGLILAILLQQQELRLQRLELTQTRVELAGQKEQLALQSGTLKLQAFENTFFQLLRLHHSIIEGMDFQKTTKSGQMVTTGRDCISVLYGRLRENWNVAAGAANNGGYSPVMLICDAYGEFNYENQSEIAHYFGNLYNIIKFVDESDVDRKHFYATLLRGQLSTYEVLFLFYYGLNQAGQGNEELKRLLEKYHMLRNVKKDELLSDDHLQLYHGNVYR